MKSLILLLILARQIQTQCWQSVACNGPAAAAYPGPWNVSIYAPTNRTLSPRSVLSWPNLDRSPFSKQVVLRGNGSLVIYDFGIEVGGLVSISLDGSGPGKLGIAFTEAKNYVGEWSDSSNGNFSGPDGALYTSLDTEFWKMPPNKLRGGFRYLSVFLLKNESESASSSGSASNSVSVILKDVNVTLDFQPTWPNLKAYQGYFQSDDDLLNRIWYAGAYTLQSNQVPTNTGRQVPFVGTGWDNNATLGPGDTIIVDGAKRDRAVWPGDMGIAVPSTFVSLGDLDSVKNALQVMYNYQNKTTGAFPEAGPPLLQKGSDTYHMWTMIGTYNYLLYTNDTEFLELNWPQYQLAMQYVVAKVDTSGLLNITGTRDWARSQQGFHNTEANTILYHTLVTGSKLAQMRNDSLASTWKLQAASLSTSINRECFDSSYGAYRDNDTLTELHPQDANSLSLLFGIANASVIPSVASRLTENWTPIGPESPELPNNISPFITSFELQGRFRVRDTARAFELLRTTWGWIVNNPNSTESTLLEGYLTNGSFGYRNTRGYDYDSSYTSHSHGWSSGPTSALTNYVVGLDVTEPLGSAWTLAPQMGDLTKVQGGFVTGLGKFWAVWQNRTGPEGGTILSGSWSTPVGTMGALTVPGCKESLRQADLVLNGEQVIGTFLGKDSPQVAVSTTTPFGEQLITISVEGGDGTVSIFYDE